MTKTVRVAKPKTITVTHTPTPWEFDGNCGGYITEGGDKIARAYAREDAEFIAHAANHYDALLAALTELSNMYASTWDGADGTLRMFGDGVARFEKAHHAAQIAVCRATGKPLPVTGDEDEEALQQTPGV